MHTVEIFEAAMQLATRLGITVRQEWLGGQGGGVCEINGHTCVFLDLADEPADHVEHLLQALHAHPRLASSEMPPALRQRLAGTRAA